MLTKYISYNQAVIEMVDYHIFWGLLIVLSLLFYVIGIAYIVYVINNYKSLSFLEIKKISLQFIILGIFDFLTYFDISIFVQESVCLRCIAIILIANIIFIIYNKTSSHTVRSLEK